MSDPKIMTTQEFEELGKKLGADKPAKNFHEAILRGTAAAYGPTWLETIHGTLKEYLRAEFDRAIDLARLRDDVEAEFLILGLFERIFPKEDNDGR